jgi:hypothetical protein
MARRKSGQSPIRGLAFTLDDDCLVRKGTTHDQRWKVSELPDAWLEDMLLKTGWAGEDKEEWLPLTEVRLRLDVDLSGTSTRDLKGISAVRAVGICNLTRNNGTKVLFKAHLANDHGFEASAHQRRLLNHPLGMITIRDKKRTEYTEAGQASLLARWIPVRAVEEQGTLTFAKLAPGDAIFPTEGLITADAGIPSCVAVLGRHRPIIQSQFNTQCESI